MALADLFPEFHETRTSLTISLPVLHAVLLLMYCCKHMLWMAYIFLATACAFLLRNFVRV